VRCEPYLYTGEVNRSLKIMLKGEELLDMVKAMNGASKSELVRAAGYVTVRKDGVERLNFTGFYEAIVAAKGLIKTVDERQSPGRKLSYAATVHFNGSLVVGKGYMEQLGAKPGDGYRIELGRNGVVRLVPTAAESQAGADEEVAEAVEPAGEEARAACPVPAVCPAPALAAVA